MDFDFGLENELHHLVCGSKMPLADAQKCIRSNWIRVLAKILGAWVQARMSSGEPSPLGRASARERVQAIIKALTEKTLGLETSDGPKVKVF